MEFCWRVPQPQREHELKNEQESWLPKPAAAALDLVTSNMWEVIHGYKETEQSLWGPAMSHDPTSRNHVSAMLAEAMLGKRWYRQHLLRT